MQNANAETENKSLKGRKTHQTMNCVNLQYLNLEQKNPSHLVMGRSSDVSAFLVLRRINSVSNSAGTFGRMLRHENRTSANCRAR